LLVTESLPVQWLALDEESKRLSVETTANQVKCIIHVWLLFICNGQLRPACSVGWWLMAGAGLL
jgi:hypothetical protein